MDFEIFRLHHRGMDCIGVKLAIQDSRNALLRKIQGIKWSQTNRCWYGEYTAELKYLFSEIFGEEKATSVIGISSKNLDAATAADESDGLQKLEGSAKKGVALGASVLEAVEKFKEHMQVIRFSENTIQNYTSAVKEFLKFFIDEDWENLDAGDMQRFQKERIIDRNLSHAYQSIMISAIKKFYEVNTGATVDPDFIKRPRKGHPLPNIFSLEQVAKLLKPIKNQKHRMMLSIGYGCGLRSGEVVKLKPEDIHTDQGMLAILQSKGNKDRMVPISANLISQMREYYKIYLPKVWLFEGEKEGQPYSQRSLQMVFKNALSRSKLPLKHKFHDLRHSYATHMMDAGTNQHVIQKILGHKNIKTTEIYTHVSKTLLQRVYNPFDNLNL